MTEWDFYQNLIDLILRPQFGNEVLFFLIIIIVILTILQYSRFPIKPWTAIARGLGRSINHDILKEQEGLKADISTLRDELNEKDNAIHEEIKIINTNRDVDKAERWRTQIIQFADEIRIGMKHSEEGFNEVLEAITRYEQFCNNNPDFPNSKATASIKIIRDVYDKSIKENNFL